MDCNDSCDGHGGGGVAPVRLPCILRIVASRKGNRGRSALSGRGFSRSHARDLSFSILHTLISDEVAKIVPAEASSGKQVGFSDVPVPRRPGCSAGEHPRPVVG